MSSDDSRARGIEHADREQWSEALKEFEDALRADPANQDLLVRCARVLNGGLSRPAEVLRLLEPRVSTATDSRVFFQLGIALADLDRFEEALTAYDRFSTLAKEPGTGVRVARAHALKSLGRIVEANEESVRALDENILEAAAWYNRACCSALLGVPRAATLSLAVAIALDGATARLAAGDRDFDSMRSGGDFQKLLRSGPEPMLLENGESARVLWKDVRRWAAAVDAGKSRMLDSFADALLLPAAR